MESTLGSVGARSIVWAPCLGNGTSFKASTVLGHRQLSEHAFVSSRAFWWRAPSGAVKRWGVEWTHTAPGEKRSNSLKLFFTARKNKNKTILPQFRSSTILKSFFYNKIK